MAQGMFFAPGCGRRGGLLPGVVGHVGELPAVLLGATHVHQGALAFLHLDDVLQDVVPVGPDGLVPVGDLVAPRGVGGDLGGEGAAFLHPLLPPAVHEPHVLVAVVLEEPEGVGGPPVVLVPVEDHGGVVGDAEPFHELGELLLADEVPDHRVPEVPLPVNLLGPRDVPGVVEEDVLVHLEDPYLGVLQVLLDPVGAHQNLGMGVPHNHLPGALYP